MVDLSSVRPRIGFLASIDAQRTSRVETETSRERAVAQHTRPEAPLWMTWSSRLRHKTTWVKGPVKRDDQIRDLWREPPSSTVCSSEKKGLSWSDPIADPIAEKLAVHFGLYMDDVAPGCPGPQDLPADVVVVAAGFPPSQRPVAPLDAFGGASEAPAFSAEERQEPDGRVFKVDQQTWTFFRGVLSGGPGW